MEFRNFFIAIGTLGLVAGLGLGIMIWAYTGAGSVAVLFQEVMPVPTGLPEAQQQLFQQGIAAYIAGRYHRATERFTQVAQQQQDCVAAVHNLGLACANLRQDDRAARALLKAAEMYLKQGDTASAELVKTQLLKLRQRKLAREARMPQ
jgi:tetratricopeptide (TPR) repeat protein